MNPTPRGTCTGAQDGRARLYCLLNELSQPGILSLFFVRKIECGAPTPQKSNPRCQVFSITLSSSQRGSFKIFHQCPLFMFLLFSLFSSSFFVVENAILNHHWIRPACEKRCAARMGRRMHHELNWLIQDGNWRGRRKEKELRADRRCRHGRTGFACINTFASFSERQSKSGAAAARCTRTCFGSRIALFLFCVCVRVCGSFHPPWL